ncbi:hypothetical protein N8630_02015, partial [Synechococcus sp. AH-601-C19]|nr:hypothetical protein [Synechococcus sp. AH-601-C19]
MTVSRWISASLLALSASCVVAAPQQATKNSQQVTKITDTFRRESATVLLRDANGQQLGSGVIVAAERHGLLVVSNRHVVGIKRLVCVDSIDRSSKTGIVVTKQPMSQHKELDVVLIWMPTTKEMTAQTAVIAEKGLKGNDFSMVVATGFPTPLSTSSDKPVYSERPGLLIPLIQTPMQDGIDLAYTAAIQKGMSGGGIFHGIELIGINSAHSEPLWPGRWLDARGKEVNEQLNQKLDLV